MHHKIILGDCLKELKKIPESSVDMVLTDPPFFIRKQITIHRQMNPKKPQGFDKKGVMKWKYKGKNITTCWDWDQQWESERDYLKWCKKWYEEIVRVLREGGHFICFWDRLKQWWMYEWGNELNMITRQPLYYLLDNPVPRARQVDFMVAVYSIFWQTKGTYSRKIATFHWELGQHRNYVKVPITPSPSDRMRHPTEKHIKVINWLLKYLSNENDLILDPFLGSGTTSVGCEQLGRNSIGIEINREYCQIAYERLKQEVEQTKFNREKSTIEKIGF